MAFTTHKTVVLTKQHAVRHDELSTYGRGYDRRWQRYSKWFRMMNPFCKCGRPTTEVDHIIPVTDRSDPKFWDTSNHRALCHQCHSAKTAKERGSFGRPPK
jgi:5-methylcytosine-specific restriction enzyme A